MTTGYTAILEEKPKTTFAEFFWRCAHGVGAFVHQRHECLSAPGPS